MNNYTASTMLEHKTRRTCSEKISIVCLQSGLWLAYPRVCLPWVDTCQSSQNRAWSGRKAAGRISHFRISISNQFAAFFLRFYHIPTWINAPASWKLNRSQVIGCFNIGTGSNLRTLWLQWSIPIETCDISFESFRLKSWTSLKPFSQVAPRPYRQASLLALCDGPGMLWAHTGWNWSQVDAKPPRKNIKPVFTGSSRTMTVTVYDFYTWLIHYIFT